MESTSRGCSGPVLGWAGWWLPLAVDWRLFEIHGNYRQGRLILGDEDRTRLELSWFWVTRRRFSVEKFSNRFLLKQVPRRSRAGVRGRIQRPALPGFSHAAFLSGDTKTMGIGYAPDTHRILHWVYHHGDSPDDASFIKETLPDWRDQPLDGETRWRFFDIAFASPPGFRLQDAMLGLGDMEVRLADPSRWGARRTLCIRHLYPAELALSRQSADAWLRGLFLKRRGPYRVRWQHRKQSDSSTGFPRIEGRLQTVVRFPLRPLAFRLPGAMEASLHHLTARNKLLYLQIAAPPPAIAGIRDGVLRSVAEPAASSSNHG